jgi:hypothetical protein
MGRHCRCPTRRLSPECSTASIPPPRASQQKNANKLPIQFQNHTELKLSMDGKGTDIYYTGVSSSTGPIMGF